MRQGRNASSLAQAGKAVPVTWGATYMWKRNKDPDRLAISVCATPLDDPSSTVVVAKPRTCIVLISHCIPHGIHKGRETAQYANSVCSESLVPST
jgi:hypothetical protein